MAFLDTDSNSLSSPCPKRPRDEHDTDQASQSSERDELMSSPVHSPLKKKYKPFINTMQDEDDAFMKKRTQDRIRLLQQRAHTEAQDSILNGTPNTKRLAVETLRVLGPCVSTPEDNACHSANSAAYDGDNSSTLDTEAAAAEDVTRVLQSADGIDMSPGNTLLFTAVDDKRLLHNGRLYILQTEAEVSRHSEESLHLKAEVARQDRTIHAWRCLAAEVADKICSVGYELNDISLAGFPKDTESMAPA